MALVAVTWEGGFEAVDHDLCYVVRGTVRLWSDHPWFLTLGRRGRGGTEVDYGGKDRPEGRGKPKSESDIMARERKREGRRILKEDLIGWWEIVLKPNMYDSRLIYLSHPL